MTRAGRFEAKVDWKYRDAGLLEVLRDGGQDDFWAVTDRGVGARVTDHRSSWVRRIQVNGSDYFVKTYDYPSWTDRRRGWFRTTAFAPSRPVREAEALDWLLAHGFLAAEVAAIGEARRLGTLRRACLITKAWPGEPADRILLGLPDRDRPRLAAAIVNLVADFHAAGFFDRNLDLRNILVADHAGEWRLAKIDSPRARIQPTLAFARRRLAAQDWDRLRRSLQECGQLLPTVAIRDH